MSNIEEGRKKRSRLRMGEKRESREAQGWPRMTKETSQELNKEMINRWKCGWVGFIEYTDCLNKELNLLSLGRGDIMELLRGKRI